MITPAVTLEAVQRDWRGFVELRPAEPAAPPLPIYELVDGPSAAWQHRHFWKRPLAAVGAVGCAFLRDVTLWHPGVATRDGLFIDDGSVPAQVALAQMCGDIAAVADPALPIRRIDRPALLVGGPGYTIWGHWIAEFLPTIGIAHVTLGAAAFGECIMPLPADTPDWVPDLLAFACGVDRSAIVPYRPGEECLHLRHAIRPSFSFSGEYTFHSFTRDFYGALRATNGRPQGRFCLSRADPRYAEARPFPLRDRFETLARAHGFEVVRPETLSLPEQVALMGDAAIVIGEYGSAMHNAVFCGAGTVIGCIGHWNAVQLRIADLFRHRSVFLTRGCVWPAGQPLRLDVAEQDIASFIDLVVSLGR